MLNITYIFSGNRSINYIHKTYEAKDFYYGFFSFDTKKTNLNIIELESGTSKILNPLPYFDRFMQKILNLPFQTSKLTSIKNLKTLLNSDKIIIVNETCGLSAIFLLFIVKIFKKTKISIFVMGLYSKKVNLKFLHKIHYLAIKIFVFFIDNLLFLGYGEYEKAKKIHRKTEKLKYFPFCIDTEFWEKDYVKKLNPKYDILFIGNDGNRDINLLIRIAKALPELSFIFISNNPELEKLNLKNIIYKKGSWAEANLSDASLKEIYADSKVSIIPLKNSTQPSGQSVALQSMLLEVPVIISKTEGFWDPVNLSNNNELLFVESNNLDDWCNAIVRLIKDEELQKILKVNAKIKVKNLYNLGNFTEQLKQYV